MNKENLYSRAVNRFRSQASMFETGDRLAQNLDFAMLCNGYFIKRGEWKYDPEIIKPFLQEFKSQKVAFFGPDAIDMFFSNRHVGHHPFMEAFRQPEVNNVIKKYRDTDEEQAARISFLFGGIVRYLAPPASFTDDAAKDSVNFAARMTMLGEEKSGDAIASAMAMYVISGGTLIEDRSFTKHVYYMADAIRQDPINPLETKDLGLSQVARLKIFINSIQGGRDLSFPDTSSHVKAFEGFPTVGAEFHFPASAKKNFPNLWKRLAILNMSQYQRSSYVQMSRNDREVIEVRMNPSVYPIAIANWNHMRLLLPELNQAFFTVTINRSQKNFSWHNIEDEELLNSLRGLGMLTYASIFDTVPHQEDSEEIDFGEVYLGQTVRMHDGKYEFEGNWGGNMGHYGQLGIYAGFGDTFPHLTYYLTMALMNPDVLKSVDLPRIGTLQDGIALRPTERRDIFTDVQNRVETYSRLREAYEAGKKIIQLLNP